MIGFSEIQRKITNGFSVEELEARLKPQGLEFKDGEWPDHSEGGFLAPNERLMEVVRADYDTLHSLGKSYEEMAQIAANILEVARSECYTEGNRLAKSLKRPVVKMDRDKYILMPIISMGFQSCPWECKRDKHKYRTFGPGHIYIMEKGKETSDLMEKYSQIQKEARDRKFPGLSFNEAQEARKKVLRDLEAAIGIKFGGMDRVLYLSAFTVITDLTPHLIASHYFFEGDSSYRTDPRKLLQVAGME